MTKTYYKLNHHVVGIFAGAVLGGLFEAIYSSESFTGYGIAIGIFVGELLGVGYSQIRGVSKNADNSVNKKQ